MKTLIQKISSRKLWLALAGVICGITLSFGADASDIQSVTGAVTAVISAVTYIITEGKIDAAAVGKVIENTTEAVDVINKEDQPIEQ